MKSYSDPPGFLRNSALLKNAKKLKKVKKQNKAKINE